jgi:WD40 repeat protein
MGDNMKQVQILFIVLFTLLSMVIFTGCNQASITPSKKQVSVNKPYEAIDALHEPKGKSEAILKLDTLGHTAKIGDVIITPNGELISASDDKTIRVWDIESGVEKRKILGQIGTDSGEIFAIALSNDQKYLAVGGFLDKPSYGQSGNIRIYNYHTGKLLKILKSHTNPVPDLAFSKDGRYLISGSNDKTAKIWSVKKNFKLQDTIRFHKKQVYAVKTIKKDNHYFAITAGFDNQIALYDMQDKRIVNSHRLDYKLQYLATNDKKEHIAVCGFGREIKIYDYNLNLIQTIHSETKPKGVSYSKDGRYLIAGTGTSPRNTNIYTTTNYKLYSSFKKHTNLTQAVGFYQQNNKLYGVSGGGDNNEIYIWDIKTLKVKTKIIGVGQRIWSVGIDGDNIAWGNKFDVKGDYHKKQSSFRKSINLKTFKIQNSNTQQFNRISTVNGSYSLTHTKGGDYGYSDAVLLVQKNNQTVTKIVKDAYTGYEHRCYGWYKDYIISGGNNGQLKIYNKDAKEVASLVGHIGTIWSIAVDGDRLVSGSSDQTMIVWDLNKVGNREVSLVKPSWFNKAWKDWINKNYPNYQIYTQNDVKRFYNRLLEDGDIGNAKKLKTPQKIYPLLNIFVSKDNEYIAWTKEGFFTASKDGAKYIGYHINQGPNKEARFVSVDKLYDTFYRPDLIAKALQGKSLEAYAKDINIEKLLKSGLAPEVKILTKSQKSKKRDIELELQVCEVDNGGYNNLTLYLNGMAVDVIDNDRALKLKRKSKSRKECFTLNKLISLQNGKNTIGFKATNSAGNIESNFEEITLSYKGRSSGKPNLYILAVGVDKYRDGDLWLKYSKADAKGFVKTIKSVSQPLFKNIYTYTLFDKDVTKENILKTFQKIGKQTTREDVFMFYMAGHGITDAKTGAYFYLPVDFRYKNENSIRERGLSQNDFKLALSKIQAMKSLVILDTCNSGSFAEAMASRGVLQKTAINKLTRATGRATIVASSKDQVALEGYKGHGVFTYTLIEALQGEGYGRDSKITIKELASYIEDVLPDRTYDKWGYEQVPQSNISGNDFPIGVK